MAHVTSEGLNGLVGNIIFYVIDGKQYARSMPSPKSNKRNKIPNERTSAFGIVSMYGSNLLKILSKSCSFPFSLSTYNTGRGWMRNQYVANQNATWPLTAKGSSMCQLNTGIDLRDFLTVDLSVKDLGAGQVEVIIGEMNPIRNIKAPSQTSEVKIKVLSASSAFAPKLSVAGKSATNEFIISYTDKMVPQKTIVLNTRAKTNDMVLVAVALDYKVNSLWVTNLQYLPAAIIAMGRME